MRKMALVAVVLLAGCGPVLAQTACPQGVAAGSARCGPGGGGIPWIMFPQTEPTGTRSPKAAARGAIRGCRSAGGEDCEVFFTYRDSCAAIAKPGGTEAIMPTYHIAAPSAEDASSLVLDACRRAHEGLACQIIYGNCSTGFYRN